MSDLSDRNGLLAGVEERLGCAEERLGCAEERLGCAEERLGCAEERLGCAEKRLDVNDGELGRFHDFALDMVGAEGRDGKLGALRTEARIHRAVLVAVASAALAAAGTAAVALYRAGESHGREQAELEVLRDRVERDHADLRVLEAAIWTLRVDLTKIALPVQSASRASP